MRHEALRDIVARKRTLSAVVVRELSCGHFQVEKAGGHSAAALRARCLECADAAPVAPVPLDRGATCTALVIPLNARRMRVCGAPATVMKRERPRCPRHAQRGAR